MRKWGVRPKLLQFTDGQYNQWENFDSNPGFMPLANAYSIKQTVV